MTKLKFCFFIFFYCILFHSSGQSLTGTNGIFRSPSAFIQSDGTAYIGSSFLPKGTYEYLGKGHVYDGLPTFFTLSLFDRVEFMFRYTHQLGHEVSPETKYFPDRMFTLRLNLLKESNTTPAITLGLHDVSEALGGTTANPWFLATYLVASKRISSSSYIFDVSFGYAPTFISPSLNKDFDGFFGGVEFMVPSLNYFKLLAEYDSKHFNVGLKLLPDYNFNLALGLLGLKSFSGYFTYRFDLLK